MLKNLVILGASGDLTRRYLLPALARLHADGRLGDDFTVVGVDRQECDDDEFRAAAAKHLEQHAGDLPQDRVGAFCGVLHHRAADVTDPDALAEVLAAVDGPAAIYLALPNTIFLPTLQALTASRPPEGSTLVVEKPFGVDLADARRLNETILGCFEENAVFRVDHFLAMQTILNVLGLRFANRIFEPVWNGLHVREVEIVWDETLALEGRAGYYDSAGALKDMIQNHLLQLLALVAMEPPTGMGHRDLRDRKVDVLRAVRPPSRERMGELTRRARYTAGEVDGGAVPDYASEDGVDPERETETFAEVTLWIENWRWAGVPFRLRSGKALGRARRHVAVRFHPAPHQPFAGSVPADELRFSLQPDAIALDINLNGAGDPFALERERLSAEFPAQDLPPYAMVLLGVLERDPTLAIRADEAEECWRIVEPVLAAWDAGEVPLQTYPAGSDGPSPARD